MSSDKTRRYELYRSCKLGVALQNSIDNMLASNSIPPEVAVQTMLRFDEAILAALQGQANGTCTFRGALHSFRCVNGTWTLSCEEVSSKQQYGGISKECSLERLRVVAQEHRTDETIAAELAVKKAKAEQRKRKKELKEAAMGGGAAKKPKKEKKEKKEKKKKKAAGGDDTNNEA